MTQWAVMISQWSSGSSDIDTKPGGPVGDGSYLVQQGDCLESIAFAHGLDWQTMWLAPENAVLRDARNANILLSGDRLFVPAIRPKSVDCATDKVHSFVRKGVPSR